MKILIDTNVLLDFLQQRESFAEAEEILSLCGRNKVQGFVAAHSFPNMFFILRKYMDSAKRSIVTRNTDDFKNSMVPAITPAAFLKTL